MVGYLLNYVRGELPDFTSCEELSQYGSIDLELEPFPVSPCIGITCDTDTL